MAAPTRDPHPHTSSAADWSVEDAFDSGAGVIHEVLDLTKSGSMMVWSKTSRRMRAAAGLLVIVAMCMWQPFTPITTIPKIPSIYLDYGQGAPSRPSIYNETKVALLIENRANPILAPLVLHFMSVVPPDWRFRFMGSIESVESINSSLAIRNMVEVGKLDLTYIPSNMSTGSQEMISRFLTNLWIYEQVLQPAEWLLVFQTDSMLCANSRQSIDDWLAYDWVGAPWNPNGKYGGNGGLSLRRVSAIIDVLRNQLRVDGTEPEDVWLTDRLGQRPNANLANGSASLTFSGEMWGGAAEKVTGEKNGKGKPKGQMDDHGYIKGIDDWRDGFYEPMGYHTGGSGSTLHGGIWGTPEMRKHIWDYCPEVKMMLQMDAAHYVPGNCNTNWKRSGDIVGGPEYGVQMGWENASALAVREVDDAGYPYLPANLVPW